MGKAHDDALCHAVMLQKPTQVVERALVVLARVAPVDVGVDVLDVDVIFVDVGQEALQVQAVHVEGGLDGEMPLLWRYAAEGVNELAADSRFPAAECDATARSQEIEDVDHHLVKQFVGRDGAPYAFGVQAPRIQAILAMQGAAMEGNQCGHPLPIDRQPMPRDRN